VAMDGRIFRHRGTQRLRLHFLPVASERGAPLAPEGGVVERAAAPSSAAGARSGAGVGRSCSW
jgi:hypothetical protein